MRRRMRRNGAIAGLRRRLLFFGVGRGRRTFAHDQQYRFVLRHPMHLEWVTKLPAGIGVVLAGSNFVPEPTHQVP